MKNLTVIVPFWNGQGTISRLLTSLPQGLPVIIVDDHSDTPPSLGRKNVTVIRPETKGYFTGACNVGINACDTDILILNQDTWFDNDNWLVQLEYYASTHDMVGERITGANPKWPNGYVHGTFLYASRKAINDVGIMSEYYPLWGSTCEWQLRFLRKGHEVIALTIDGFNHEHREWNHFGSAITEMIKRHPEQKTTYLRTPPEISVIIPCYNYGRYLSDAIHSLIGGETCLGTHPGQTFQSFEIIIVDDGSTDNSLAIAQSFGSRPKGIRVVSKENGGTASAINAGIDHAFGNYISILSADDMMEPWRLEALLNAIRQQKPDSSYVYDDLRLVVKGKRTSEVKLGKYDWNKLRYKNHVHAGILFPVQAWHKTGGYPNIMTDGREDWAFNMALGAAGYHGVNIHRPGYLYRREGQNRTEQSNATKQNGYLEKIMFLYPHLYTEKEIMACCGGKGKMLPSSKGKVSANAIAGSSGMVMVEYIGKNVSDTSWYGAKTRTRYVVGGITKRIYIDQKDLDGFLQFDEGEGKAIFKQIDPNAIFKAKVTAPAVEVTPKTAVGAKIKIETVSTSIAVASFAPPSNGDSETIAELEESSPLPDLSEMSVRSIRTHLADNTYSEGQFGELIEAEKLGKNRSAVIASLEKYANYDYQR